jgi:hypothetical protein
VKLSLGIGHGGCMLTLRFGAEAGREAELQKHLTQVAMPPLTDIVSVVGVHLCVADRAASDIRTTERGDRKVDIPNWLVMIEGATAEATDEACNRLLEGNPGAHGATSKMERGLYMLQFCRVKTPGWAG